MTALIRYTIYTWAPPNLSVSEKVALGRQISRVGRKPFVAALKARLSPPTPHSRAEPFTYADVLRDAQKMRDGNLDRTRPSLVLIILSILFFAGCAWAIVAAGHVAAFFVAAAFVIAVSGGSLFWVHSKVDRWVQSLIDEYTHAVANGKTSP